MRTGIAVWRPCDLVRGPARECTCDQPRDRAATSSPRTAILGVSCARGTRVGPVSTRATGHGHDLVRVPPLDRARRSGLCRAAQRASSTAQAPAISRGKTGVYRADRCNLRVAARVAAADGNRRGDRLPISSGARISYSLAELDDVLEAVRVKQRRVPAKMPFGRR